MISVQINFTKFIRSIGWNPNFPNQMDSKLPNHVEKWTSEIVAKNLWNSFKGESDEQIRHELRYQTQDSGDRNYLAGNIVFYKRNINTAWTGLGTAIGQNGQQVLMKHGSSYITSTHVA